MSIIETDHSDQATPEGAAGGQGDWAGPFGLELLQVDPRTLVIGANVRADAALDKAFVGSIKDRGVREPIIVRRDGEGRLVVRKGQRRTLGAIQAGRDLVTVVVEPESTVDDGARQVDRLIDQLGENKHRTGITVGDEVRAHQELLDLGLSAGQIARRTRTGVGRVRATEFDGNDQAGDAVQALIEAASTRPRQFEHVAHRARDARAEARLRAELTGQLAGAGVRIIDRPEAGRWAAAGQATTTGGGQAGGLSVEERAERREVVANNKVWASATTVRLAWLRRFLARRTPPKDAPVWIAATLAEGCHAIRRAMEDQHSLARDLLGLGDTDEGQRWYRGCGRQHPTAAAAQGAAPGRATMLSLALLLAAHEAGTSKDTWRHPDAEAAGYLTALAGWGYELSQIELLAVSNHTGQHTLGDAAPSTTRVVPDEADLPGDEPAAAASDELDHPGGQVREGAA